MKDLISYHGDHAIKLKYLARVAAHREADHLVQGVGWESNGKTRGCAVGCTLESYDHARYPIELGLPEWLARLEDFIFEKLPVDEAMLWPERFLSAIPVGVNVERVRHQLSVLRLDRLTTLQRAQIGKHKNLDKVLIQVVAAIDGVRALHYAEVDGKTCDFEPAWSAARSAAWSAAWSAWSAESASWSAESAAWSAWSAWSAESAARSAVRSAWSAESAARSARSAWSAVKQEAEDLIRLLSECRS